MTRTLAVFHSFLFVVGMCVWTHPFRPVKTTSLEITYARTKITLPTDELPPDMLLPLAHHPLPCICHLPHQWSATTTDIALRQTCHPAQRHWCATPNRSRQDPVWIIHFSAQSFEFTYECKKGVRLTVSFVSFRFDDWAMSTSQKHLANWDFCQKASEEAKQNVF